MGKGKSTNRDVTHFTIEEAETILPVVSKLMRKGQRLRDKIAWLLESHEGTVEVSSDEGFHFFVTEQINANKEFHRLYFQFYKTIEELNELGVIVKDIDEGLVDFPFKVNGTDSSLCWQVGEDKIRYWHDADSCFHGRQPIVDIDELMQKKDL